MAALRIKDISWLTVKNSLRRAGASLVVIAIVLAGFFGSHLLAPRNDLAEQNTEEASASGEAVRYDVNISPEKILTGKIRASEIQERPLQTGQTVPGTIKYNAAKHVELRAATECIVKKTNVKPGQWVNAGDELVVLTGAEVGAARNLIDKSAADVEIARAEYNWTAQIDKNLKSLLTLLQQEPDIKQVEKQFDREVLGEYRDMVVPAYSQFVLSRRFASRTDELKGIISGRTAETRESDREIAAANFKGTCENSLFQSTQDLAKAKAALDQAQNALEVSQEKLSGLLGQNGKASAGDGANRSEFVLVAPRDGQVAELMAVDSGRFNPGETLLVVADTRTVWVAAQINQRDWQALSLADGQELKVIVPAIPNQTFLAKVRYTGGAVSATTLSVPLFAELENSQQLFRPGMFVWVELPAGESRQTLAVPVSAVQRHDGATFVFQQTGELSFRRVDVKTGRETDDLVEIVAGLQPRDRIVDSGAFYLKSELLLERE